MLSLFTQSLRLSTTPPLITPIEISYEEGTHSLPATFHFQYFSKKELVVSLLYIVLSLLLKALLNFRWLLATLLLKPVRRLDLKSRQQFYWQP